MLQKHQEAQQIAKATIDYLTAFIKEGVREDEIACAANYFMMSKGISSFWYHNVGSLVLAGERTAMSISDRIYSPSDKAIVGHEDLVTVDLSPQIEGCWGDYARSFVVSQGRVIASPPPASSQKVRSFFSGIEAEDALHSKLMEITAPGMTFEELYTRMNTVIRNAGYANLDFKGNLGHSIAGSLDERVYIEQGSKARLGDFEMFTFEPHIRKVHGRYGFKREDIYYFSDGKLATL